MKTENEIRAKLTKYMEKLHDHDNPPNEQEREWYYGITDALLWVIGDESGMPI